MAFHGFDLDLTTHLAGWRFVGWTIMLLLSALITDYVRVNRRQLPGAFVGFLRGISGFLATFGLHQFYWWHNEDLRARGNCESTDIDYDVVLCALQHDWQSWNAYVTPFAYMIGGLFLAMAIAPLLRMRSNLSCRAVSAMSGAWLVCVFVAGIALAMR